MTEETKTETTPEAPTPTMLTVSDLRNIASIIDMSVKGGVFNAQQAAAVGLLYNKVTQIIAENTPAEEKTEDADTTSAAQEAA